MFARATVDVGSGEAHPCDEVALLRNVTLEEPTDDAV